MTVVLWARHGENAANVTRTLSHRVIDPELTARGTRQAEHLGQSLASAGRTFGVLVCSPLQRARQTAQIVGARLDLPITAEREDLREVDVGDLDGRNDAAAWAVYDATLAAWRAGHLDQRFPGGESGHELASRIRGALQAVARLAQEAQQARQGGLGEALIVAHGANIRAAFPVLTGRPDPGADLPTGGAAEFDVRPEGEPPSPSPRRPVGVLSWPGWSAGRALSLSVLAVGLTGALHP